MVFIVGKSFCWFFVHRLRWNLRFVAWCVERVFYMYIFLLISIIIITFCSSETLKNRQPLSRSGWGTAQRLQHLLSDPVSVCMCVCVALVTMNLLLRLFWYVKRIVFAFFLFVCVFGAVVQQSQRAVLGVVIANNVSVGATLAVRFVSSILFTSRTCCWGVVLLTEFWFVSMSRVVNTILFDVVVRAHVHSSKKFENLK